MTSMTVSGLEALAAASTSLTSSALPGGKPSEVDLELKDRPFAATSRSTRAGS